MKKFAFSAIALLAATTATPALAAKIIYTVSGTFSGSTTGGDFSNVFGVFTGVGDTENTNNSGFGEAGIFSTPLSTLTLVAGGLTYNITTPSIFFKYPGTLYNTGPGTRLGIGFNNDGQNALGLESTQFNGYSGTSSFSTTPGATYFPGAGQSARFDSVGEGTTGSITIESFTGGSFGAAVPEPATWAMMIAGFGFIGFAMRRRPKLRTTVSFA